MEIEPMICPTCKNSCFGYCAWCHEYIDDTTDLQQQAAVKKKRSNRNLYRREQRKKQ